MARRRENYSPPAARASGFAVRNSGADAVIEGCGSNGCEYMTGGTVVILGAVGANFAAGMTGGTAYIYDWAAQLNTQLNHDLVKSMPLPDDAPKLFALLEEHVRETNSLHAAMILKNWPSERQYFYQVSAK